MAGGLYAESPAKEKARAKAESQVRPSCRSAS